MANRNKQKPTPAPEPECQLTEPELQSTEPAKPAPRVSRFTEQFDSSEPSEPESRLTEPELQSTELFNYSLPPPYLQSRTHFLALVNRDILHTATAEDRCILRHALPFPPPIHGDVLADTVTLSNTVAFRALYGVDPTSINWGLDDAVVEAMNAQATMVVRDAVEGRLSEGFRRAWVGEVGEVEVEGLLDAAGTERVEWEWMAVREWFGMFGVTVVVL